MNVTLIVHVGQLSNTSIVISLCARAVNALHHEQPAEGQTTDECFYFEGEKCLP